MIKRIKIDTFCNEIVLTYRVKNGIIFNGIIIGDSICSKNTRIYFHNTKNLKIKKQRSNKKKEGNVQMNEQKYTIESKSIGIYDSSRFFAKMFIATRNESKYTSSKIEKMLSIAYFYSLYQMNLKLFDTNLQNRACGTGFSELIGFLPNSLNNIEYDYTSEITTISCENILKLLKDSKYPRLLEYDFKEFFDELPKCIIELYLNVFIEFCRYSPKDLGNMIDSFKENILDDDKKIISDERIKDYFSNVKEKRNHIIKFVVS